VKLWLVRHAAPDIDAGICYGRSDIPARVDATRDAALALAAVLPPARPVQGSPLQRCEQLSQAVRGLRPDLTLKTDARLAEMDFGDWEGRTWHAVGETALGEWTAAFFTHRPGGGESVQGFMARVDAALQETRAGAEDAVWFTHAGVIRAVNLLVRGVRRVDRAGDWPQAAPAFGAWQVLDC
jgi:alpha-ribazole phosphatase